MATPNKALALSATETEAVRDMRSRLNRRAISDAAQLSLGTAFLQTCARIDIAASEPLPVETLSGAAVVKVAAAADLATLARLVATLRDAKAEQPKTWPALVAAGAPQAILSRRLALAGREPAVEPTVP
ncbi:hypothetical protein [Phenylobacterium sp.]|uniref:hypothetical protein n=1 Tax=Phenylobacterium sp. TaxID=1871053 RepID=UPI0027351A2C|nr:hypothetical protein [Phenylobacterium sp.]MDP3660180.1 hypothetical protein [Phenylobacterium sp.]